MLSKSHLLLVLDLTTGRHLFMGNNHIIHIHNYYCKHYIIYIKHNQYNIVYKCIVYITTVIYIYKNTIYVEALCTVTLCKRSIMFYTIAIQ